MPSKLTVGIAQVHTQQTTEATLDLLRTYTKAAASKDVSILLFPEAFLGGYPRTCNFGAAIGARTEEGRTQFLHYYKSCVDLGDTARGEEDAWLKRKLEINEETGRRGDGTREYLEDVARENGVFLVVGMVERAGSSLYCAAVYVDPAKGVVGKRRKVQPTGSERLVWAQGQPSSLRAVSATIKGVRVVMGTAICWENYMPLLRYSLYAQGVNLWLAPTADPRATWEPLMQTIACEQRCWVLSGNQCIKSKDLPGWITGSNQPSVDGGAVNGLDNNQPKHRRRSSVTTKTQENHEIAWRPTGNTIGESNALEGEDSAHFASAGGSCIVSPMGQTVTGPIWNKDEELLYAEIDFDECQRGKLDFDAAGHYGRLDAFKLTVEGLDMTPPP
jgi:nitrilase